MTLYQRQNYKITSPRTGLINRRIDRYPLVLLVGLAMLDGTARFEAIADATMT